MKQMWTPWRLPYILSDKQGGCVFCDILDNPDDTETLIVHRGDLAFLVLNKYPYNNGHFMAVPYRHVASPEDLNATELTELMQLLTLGMRALRGCLRPEGFNIGANIGRVAGAGVKDHIHLHVVPRWNGDTNFMPVFAEVRVIPQALSDTYVQFKAALDATLAAQL